MHLFTHNLNKTLINELNNIDLEELNASRKSQKSIHCIKNTLKNLKIFILNYSFKDEEEEILFFKEIKPQIFSQLIYYVEVFNIENRRPLGSYEIQKKFLCHELGKLTFFFNNHLEFYQYYRMNFTYLDDKYFVRGKEDSQLYQDSLMFYVDNNFSTSYDYMVAKIIANDRLEVFLKTELDALSIKANNPNWGQLGVVGNIPLQWTDNKTALVELIYALYATGSINNGQSEIRELAAFFEQAFNVRLTDVYHTYLEIKIRSTPTKFIDNLRAALLHKMEEDY
jgi:hypothetical protein